MYTGRPFIDYISPVIIGHLSAFHASKRVAHGSSSRCENNTQKKENETRTFHEETSVSNVIKFFIRPRRAVVARKENRKNRRYAFLIRPLTYVPRRAVLYGHYRPG